VFILTTEQEARMYELLSKQDETVLSIQEQDELTSLQDLDKNSPEEYDVEDEEVE